MAAAQTGNDPYTAVEHIVDKNEALFHHDVRAEIWRTDEAISRYSSSHTYVRGNWIGSIWLWDPASNGFVYTAFITNI